MIMPVKWDKKIEDRHMKGITQFGLVYIRFDKKNNATAMYTLFGSTKKYIPDEEMRDIEGAQLQLEIITEDTKRTHDWGKSLRSKT